jgi:dTDP-4-amino-4,6-dideoxygalactose transaminase
MIPFTSPEQGYERHKEKILAAIEKTLDSGKYILGPEVESFEREFSQYCDVPYAIGVASGTDAIELGLRALGIKQNDAVFSPSYTAVATIAAIERAGATPIFVDIDPVSRCINPESLRDAVEQAKRISLIPKCIIAVHIYGQPCEMDQLSIIATEHDMFLLEDCAQAHGALYNGYRAGSIGDLGTFSFYPTKNLGCLGDGGGIVSKDKNLNDKLIQLRQYGWDHKRDSQISGVNSRLDELQAAILRVKLRYLEEDNQQRRFLAARYFKQLSGLPCKLPQEQPNTAHVYHLFVIETDKRDQLREFLKEHGVLSSIHYRMPVHMQSIYQKKYKPLVSLHETEKLSKNILSLPMFPELRIMEVDIICDIIKAWYK